MAGVQGRSGGHNAKTAKELALSGGYRKDRHAGMRNPEPTDGIPVPPKRLAEGDTADEWARMLDRLTDCKTLSAVDAAALFQYCCLFAETEEIRVRQLETAATIDLLEENLGDLKGVDLVAAFQEIGKMRALEFKYTTQIRQGRMAQRVFLVEFGLTPASRGRVKLPQKQEAVDPLAEFESDAVQ